jgi:hypothetical protein
MSDLIHPHKPPTFQHDPGFYVLLQGGSDVGSLSVVKLGDDVLETWTLRAEYQAPPASDTVTFRSKPNGTAPSGTTYAVECAQGAPPEITGAGGAIGANPIFDAGIYWLLQGNAEVGRLVVEPGGIASSTVLHWYLYRDEAGIGTSGNPRRPYFTPGVGDVDVTYKRSEAYRPIRLEEVLPAGSPTTTYIRGVVFSP